MSTEKPAPPVILGRYAGFFSRAAAYIIDRLIIFAIVFVIMLVINYFLSLFRIDQWLAARVGSTTNQIITTLLSSIGITLVVSIFYDISFWMLSGQTPGKRFLGVRVMRADGERLKLRNAILRQIGYYISTILYLGFIWILFDNRRQGFHDKIAGTIVTYSWPEGRIRGTFIIERVQRFQDRRLKS
ncbi:MAG: RDD family protein [Anaerolineales bacterium]|jgi:uncharacterized RDD family membrane protein YckC